MDRKTRLLTRWMCLITGVALAVMDTAAMSEEHVGRVLFSANEQGSGKAIPFRLHLRSTKADISIDLARRYISIFEAADTDHDRRIVLDDFEAADRKFGREMFKTLDQDRDNVLFREELPDSSRDFLWFEVFNRNFSIAVAPDPAQQPKLPLWHDQFSCPGPTTFSLPEGEYEYVVARGPEYTTAQGTFDVSAGDVLEFSPTLDRLADLASEGWWSGAECRTMHNLVE